jgi:glycosyltransferase involved in cell wall biosynthesis
MDDRNYRLLVVSSHVVQYASHTFRLLADHPQLDLLVAYCSLQGAESGFDPEFGVEVGWDIPLLDGYKWTQVPPKFVKPRLGSFFGLVNPGLWKLIRTGNFDAVLVLGHSYLSLWIAIVATKLSRSALIMASDATTLRPLDGRNWKIPLKEFLLPRVFGLADVTCAASSGTVKLLQSFSIGSERIVLSPGTTDNDRFMRALPRFSRAEVRSAWKVPPESPVALFCGKLQPWKRPLDLLEAFAQAQVPEAHLVFAGDGPLRSELDAKAHGLGVAERVHVLGFVNQSQLPGVYVSSDLLVLPSEFETFGLVVTEAMSCGLPVVVSDQVGARFDLVDGQGTGFVYPAGDVKALAKILHDILPDRSRVRCLGEAAKARMVTWSPREKTQSFLQAVKKAVELKQQGART